jgi:chemotaxis response regulator CheB
MSPLGVLLVEDFEPFRRLVSLMLAKKPDLQIVAEVSDGLEAIQKAEELKPDLILLDIGLRCSRDSKIGTGSKDNP